MGKLSFCVSGCLESVSTNKTKISVAPFIYSFTVCMGYWTEKRQASFWNPLNISSRNQVWVSKHRQIHISSGLCWQAACEFYKKKMLFFQGSRRSLNLRPHRYDINTHMANFHWYSFISTLTLFFLTYIISLSCSLYLLFVTADSEDWKSQLKNVQHQWKSPPPQIVFTSWGKKQK